MSPSSSISMPNELSLCFFEILAFWLETREDLLTSTSCFYVFFMASVIFEFCDDFATRSLESGKVLLVPRPKFSIFVFFMPLLIPSSRFKFEFCDAFCDFFRSLKRAFFSFGASGSTLSSDSGSVGFNLLTFDLFGD